MRRLHNPFRLSGQRLAVVWLAAVALLLTASPTARAAEQDIFSVMGIELDVRARTATLARERAIAQAEVKGFAALLYKLLDHDSPLVGKVHPAAQIRSMVRAFEIGEEKSASGRYIATYHVSYDPRSVRQYLGRLNVAFSEIPGDRLLVFPIFERHGSSLLWEETNPWWQVIRPGLLKNYLHDFVVPAASFEERLAWSPGNLTRPSNRTRLAQLLAEYDADDALLIKVRIVSGGDQGRQAIFEYRRLSANFPSAQGRIHLLEGDEESDVLGRVFTTIAERFDSGWKTRTEARFGSFKILVVQAKVENIDAWIRIRGKLEDAAMVRGIKIEELAMPIASLEIRYLGTEEQLRLTLEQVGLTLNVDAGVWRLSEPTAGPELAPRRAGIGG